MLARTFRRWTLVLAVMLLGSLNAAAQTLEDVFNDNIVQEVRLIVTRSDWQNLRDNYELDIYYPAIFTWRYNGKDIGLPGTIEIKSRGSGSRSGIKPSLKLDMNRDDPTQLFFGLKSLVLRNNSQDATEGMHERLSMMLFSWLGVPVPRQAYCRLYVSTDGGKTFPYFGLYTMVEPIDERYVQTYLGDDGSGYLYKYAWVDNFWFTYLGANPSLYSGDNFRFQPETHKSNPDARPLEALFRTINQAPDSSFVSDVSQYVDAKAFMTQIAIENFVADYDGMIGAWGANNFYTYRPTGSNVHRFLPWDKSETFKAADADIMWNTDQNILSKRLLAVPQFQKIYMDTLAKAAVVLGGTGGWADKEAAFQYDQTHADVLADPNRLCAGSDGMPARCSVQQYEDGYTAVRQFALNRAASVMTQLAAKGYDLRATNGATWVSNDIAPGSLITVWGSGLSNSTVAPPLPLPTKVDGVEVTINGIAAPLLFVSPYQINLQVPYEVTAGPATITITGSPTPNAPIQTTVSAASPGIFAVAHNADWKPVTPDYPAKADEVVVAFVNGLGAVNGTVVTGQPATDAFSTKSATTATVGQFAAKVWYSGLAPGWVGLYQVNVQLPSRVFASDRTPLALTIGGQLSLPAFIATR